MTTGNTRKHGLLTSAVELRTYRPQLDTPGECNLPHHSFGDGRIFSHGLPHNRPELTFTIHPALYQQQLVHSLRRGASIPHLHHDLVPRCLHVCIGGLLGVAAARFMSSKLGSGMVLWTFSMMLCFAWHELHQSSNVSRRDGTKKDSGHGDYNILHIHFPREIVRTVLWAELCQSLWGPGDYKEEMEEMLVEQAAIEASRPKSPLQLLRPGHPAGPVHSVSHLWMQPDVWHVDGQYVLL
ncbi:hypothetical protein WMY93_012499 [Mugilogobius chulae]|uniref:Uncharacterized protein n=1 Tax=Mugilogobius chulae TaxID=88201 RepID=A0AAW0P5M9_9GOBI